MRRWALTHPELGELEVLEGTEAELRDVDPDWDKKPARYKADAASDSESAHGDGRDHEDEGKAGSSTDPEEEAAEETTENLTVLVDWLTSCAEHLPGPLRRFRPRLHELARRVRQSIETYVLVRRDGVVLARMAVVNDGGISLGQAGEPPVAAKPGQVTRPSRMAGQPKLRFETTGLREIVAVYYMGEEGTVALPPPPGGLAERRMREMEDSPAKRVLYPVLGGFDKAGSALAVLWRGLWCWRWALLCSAR